MNFEVLKREWFSNSKRDILSGIVVALALIPEAIAFSAIAGVDPKVGLYASFSIAVIISIVGGRPAMISAATAAMAVLMIDLFKDHGIDYLLATTVLTGIIQVIAGYLKLANLMRFVSKSVITGFVNALAILIFMAQLPDLIYDGATWEVYALTLAGLGIIYLFPYLPAIGKMVPSPLVCIIVISALAFYLNMNIQTVSSKGDLPDSLPIFALPNIPLTLETLWIILPYALALATVGLLESLMTANIVDDLTDTESDKHRECKGQGVANIFTGFIGGMAGCAMIGQSVINVKSGGRGRLSTFVAGIFLLILVVFLDDLLKLIAMPALVAVMIMVSIGTFSWDSILDIKKIPLSSTIVMLATVVVVIATHNLALGVLIGVLLSALFFANKMARFMVVRTDTGENKEHRYEIIGQVFFASTDKFLNSFDYKTAVDKVTLDLTQAHLWDVTAVAALDKVVLRFKREGADVELIGMNQASRSIVDQFGIHNKPEEVEKFLKGH